MKKKSGGEARNTGVGRGRKKRGEFLSERGRQQWTAP